MIHLIPNGTIVLIVVLIVHENLLDHRRDRRARAGVCLDPAGIQPGWRGILTRQQSLNEVYLDIYGTLIWLLRRLLLSVLPLILVTGHARLLPPVNGGIE